MKLPAVRPELRVTTVYIIIGGLWILLSDSLLAALIIDPATLTRIQTYKGWFFILTSGSLLYIYLRRELSTRRLTQHTLDLSENQIAGIVESAMDGIISIDSNQRIILMNSAAEQMFGYGQDELLGQSIDNLIPLSFRKNHRRQVQTFGRTGATTRSRSMLGEISGLHANGMEFPIESSISRTGAAGQIRYTVILRDITERKRAEQEIAILSRFPAENPNPVLRLSADGKILYANPQSIPLLDFWGRQVGEAAPEDWKVYVVEVLDSGLHREIEFEIAERTISCIFAPIREAGYVNVYGRDVTERKRAEDQIRRQLKRLNSLRMIDIALISSFDLQVVLNVVLQQIHAQLGIDATAVLLVNPNLRMMEYAASLGFRSNAIQHAQLKLSEGYASRAITERRTVHSMTISGMRGETAKPPHLTDEGFVDYYGIPLIVKGEVKGVLEVYHRAPLNLDSENLDFLETLAGQAAIAIDNSQLFYSLQRANFELEQRVEERTAELNRTNRELEHANQAKDEFLATMSHELRTPLNSILGLSETLLEQRQEPLSEQQQNSLEIIATSGRHLLELINDVLDLSKIEAGKFDYYPQVIEANASCQSSLSFVRQQAMRKHIELGFDEDPAVSKIHADPRRLKQILVNLLTNAVKFTPENGRVTLQVRSDPERDLIQFSVIDTGIGIAREDMSKLFQPFSQVDSSLAREFEGTGLGLALVQKLTDLHGGSVEVQSEPGRGSRFTISIPWRRDLLEQQDAIESGARFPGKKAEKTKARTSSLGTILLAEDNMANSLTIGEYLESHGYEVVNAQDGLQAIELAEKINPLLILMDIQMPALDGLEATRRLRKNPRFASTPIIALTALAMPGDRERCLEAGANDYMSKPVGLNILVKTIRALLKANEAQ